MESPSLHHRLLLQLAPRSHQVGTFQTGMQPLDALTGSPLARGAVHEFLSADADGDAFSAAVLFAMSAVKSAAISPAISPAISRAMSTVMENKTVVCCDVHRAVYLPALIARGLDANRVLVLRPGRPIDQVWAIAECLRCKGVSAVIAAPPRLTRVEARRLQLAAEQGGGVGLFMRPVGRASEFYSAATRWLIEPAPGDSSTQRWNVRLLHGHGRFVGQSVNLEVSRDDNSVRAIEQLADPAIRETPSTLRIA